MSLARLQTRLARLEERAYQLIWYDEDLTWLVQRIAEAAIATGLAPDAAKALCAAVRHAGEELGRQGPRRYKQGDTVQKTVSDRLIRTVRMTIDMRITEPQTRTRLHREIQHAFAAAREAK
jgi:hypothetical protein